jgi:hypothetical protein
LNKILKTGCNYSYLRYRNDIYVIIVFVSICDEAHTGMAGNPERH